MGRNSTPLVLDRRQLAVVLTSREMTAAMHARAEKGMAWAQQQARAHAYDATQTGVDYVHYADSFEIRDTKRKVNGINRSVTVLVNTDSKAWAVEWGKGGHHIMQQAVDHMKKIR